MFEERLQHANLDGAEATAASKDKRCSDHYWTPLSRIGNRTTPAMVSSSVAHEIRLSVCDSNSRDDLLY
jgi:hypothetical protein